VKRIKFAAERGFCINEAHVTGTSKEKYCAKQNAVIEHSGTPKPENFLRLKKNYLNTSKKHRPMAMLYLMRCYSYECVR
jgi:hypothetical protein